jgi:MYXO-CTERM domain-containing protein
VNEEFLDLDGDGFPDKETTISGGCGGCTTSDVGDVMVPLGLLVVAVFLGRRRRR